MTPLPLADEQEAEAPKASRAPRRRAVGCLVEVVETLVVTFLIFFGIQTFVAQPYKVQQVSMENTVLPDQFVLVDKLTPRWAPYARGDIVVFEPPPSVADGGVPFIKRVIGLPGDRVELRDGLVYVNGSKLDEPYIYREAGIPQRTEPEGSGTTSWLIQPGELLVMGDHREESSDSRSFGPIKITQVIGRAWLRYWPLDTFGVLPAASYRAP